MKPFFFKQFKIIQDNTAMKVGTDGVLLGAWTNCKIAQNILDIGTGTGLIALMLAQKNETANITAIEIEENAFYQAKENVNNSKWENRVKLIKTSLQDYKPKIEFDLIVSNPPFFNNTYQNKIANRNIARQIETLNFSDLLLYTSRLLTKEGKVCFIIPFSEKNNFIEIASFNNLFLNRILYVKGNLKTEIKRILIELSFIETKIEEKNLTIEISRHNYTGEYIELVQDFYLKM